MRSAIVSAGCCCRGGLRRAAGLAVSAQPMPAPTAPSPRRRPNARTATTRSSSRPSPTARPDQLGDLTDRLLTAPAARETALHQTFGRTLTYDMKTRVVTVASQPASSVDVRSCPRTDTHHTYTPVFRGELLLP